MPASITYSYYIKPSSTGTYPTTASYTGTNTSYTFSGLTQETNYDVKVTAKDKAGNIGTGTLLNTTTTKVGGATGDLTTGNIVASNPTWSSGTASITLTTSTGLQIQYQVGSISGQWTTIASGGKVTGLAHNQTVYARLYDGTNYGDYASVTIKDLTKPNAPTIGLTGTAGTNSYYKSNVTVKITAGSDGQSGANRVRYKVTGAQTVAETTTAAGTTTASITITAEGTSTITAYTLDKAGNVSAAKTQVVYKDATVPTASITVGTKSETSIAITVKASDATSGLATSGTYKYYLGSTLKTTNTTKTYTYSGLTAGTSYTLKVEVTDKAGNVKTVSTTASTEKIDEVGDFVGGGSVNKSTQMQDSLQNKVWIPGGFKVASDSGTRVEDGIVIEDSKGNQFVWVPVGTYKTSSGNKTNNLSRRTFTSTGATEVSGDSAIGSYYYGEGDSRSVASGTIGAFKTSATTKGGFYIGRYEQGTGNVIKKNVAPYVSITRNNAKTQAEAIDGGSSYVVSELISSYAWDTALNFICQTNSAGYTLATTTSSTYGNINTNSKKSTGMYTADKYSNICDMLGNCWEWTTEYYSYSGGNGPCVFRGGCYIHQYYYAANRDNATTNNSYTGTSFRTQLYVK